MVAVTGLVRRKPMQRDLFTGELSDKKPKAGNGKHIRLHSNHNESIKAPGMAYFPATGPVGRTCGECVHLQDLHRSKTGRLLPSERHPQFHQTEGNACKKAAEITGTVQRGDLQFNRACKYFELSTAEKGSK